MSFERLHAFVVDQKCVPWTVANRWDLWLEGYARHRLPKLYRLARFRRLRNIVFPLTRGPRHHFFGYYDKSPWNGTQKHILTHEVAFNDRPPTERDEAAIGVVRLDGDRVFESLGATRAWNWQQGAMLQWDPRDPEDRVLYNDRRADGFVAVLASLRDGEVTAYHRPLYAIAPDGSRAYSLNFARLQTHRPGYGYPGIRDPWAADPAPEQDGIYAVDLGRDASALLISLSQLAETNPVPTMNGAFHWVNHIQVAPGGRHLAFFHRWQVNGGFFGTRLYTIGQDGTGLTCILEGAAGKGRIGVSHYDWRDAEHLAAWAQYRDVGERFVLCHRRTGPMEVIGEGILTEDGHCSFSPNQRWLLDDTYPDRHGVRTLLLYDLARSRRIDVGRFYTPAHIRGEIRCDLHPRWSRDGRRVCVDSVHTGERQMYLVDLQSIAQPTP